MCDLRLATFAPSGNFLETQILGSIPDSETQGAESSHSYQPPK